MSDASEGVNLVLESYRRRIETAFDAGDFVQERNLRKEYLALLVRLHGDSHPVVSQERAWLKFVERLLTLGPQQQLSLRKVYTSYAEGKRQFARGAPEPASQLLEEACRAHRQALSQENSPTLVCILNEWAAARMDLGDLKRARTLRSEAVPMIREVFGDNHPNYGTMLLTIAAERVQNEADPAAEEVIHQALRIFDTWMGPESDMAACSHSLLAVLSNTRQRFAEAKAEAQQAESVLQRQLPDNYVDSACNYLQLGKACAGLESYDEAARPSSEHSTSSTPSSSCPKSNDIENSSPSTPLCSAT